jgi:hypothetical protein
MSDEQTMTKSASAGESTGPEAELAWLVAALGGGPGERRERGAHHQPAEPRATREDRPNAAAVGD